MTRARYFYIACGILAFGLVLSLGFKTSVRGARSRPKIYIAEDKAKIIAEGIDQYKLKHGHFPEFQNFQEMIKNTSPLVIENLIPVNMPICDPWGHPYIGHSTINEYRIQCGGDPSDPIESGPFFLDSSHQGLQSQQAAP